MAPSKYIALDLFLISSIYYHKICLCNEISDFVVKLCAIYWVTKKCFLL